MSNSRKIFARYQSAKLNYGTNVVENAFEAKTKPKFFGKNFRPDTKSCKNVSKVLQVFKFLMFFHYFLFLNPTENQIIWIFKNDQLAELIIFDFSS